MPLEELRKTLSDLRVDVAEIKPLAAQIPKIAEAMELLAGVTAKLENNVEEHKRIHWRITGIEKDVNTLKEEFGVLKEEHIECNTTRRVERRGERAGWWPRVRAKALDKAVEIVTLAIIGFTAWMVISHLKDYSKTAPIINGPSQSRSAVKP